MTTSGLTSNIPRLCLIGFFMLKRLLILSFICLFVFLLVHLVPGEARGDESAGKSSFSSVSQSIVFPDPEVRPSPIVDRYGILEMPHRYAVKFVKYPGSLGRLETYEKVGDRYIMRHTYTADYPKEGTKSSPWDMKTVGGNVVRYIYRTTHSGMNGRDKNGESFGVYKVSFPMPHDVEPLIKAGKIPESYVNKIPIINYRGPEGNQMLYPHPESIVGANIVLHTARKGSRGCMMVENEAMSRLYHEDLITENDKEIIPLVIYDEDVIAPPIGELF